MHFFYSARFKYFEGILCDSAYGGIVSFSAC